MHTTILTIFFATYAGVFVAEIVGDKLLYTTGVLATRFRIATVVLGVLLAFMAKMGVAVVLFEKLATSLPKWLVATMTGVNFLALAIVLWRKPDFKPAESSKKLDHTASQGILASFSAVFFSEWGDKGQLACAFFATKFATEAATGGQRAVHAAMIAVWLGAVAAMMTKGTLAATAGDIVRRWVQKRIAPKTVRYAAVALYLCLGTLSVLEILGYMAD